MIELPHSASPPPASDERLAQTRSVETRCQLVRRYLHLASFPILSFICGYILCLVQSGRFDTNYPLKYGKVPEKTLWFFYDKGFDPLPNVLMGLCIETWKKHHPDWNIEKVSDSNILEYVHRRWLPDNYFLIYNPPNKKDVAMAALLAAYGGVAADGTIINLQSLTDWWDVLVQQGQTFRGYRYEWGETVCWFWMARRDSGIFRRYVSDVTLRMGQWIYGRGIPGRAYLALASGSMDPILEEIDSNLPVCREVKNGQPGVEQCSQGKQYHVSGNQDLSNQKLIILDPRSNEFGPELIGMDEMVRSGTEPLLSKHSDMWNDYQAKKNNTDFKMIKLFQSGGKWAKEQKKVDSFIKPDGTPDSEINILGALFKDAGLTPHKVGDSWSS